MGFRKPKFETDEEMEAYECGREEGYEEGYEAAKKEFMGQMGYRNNFGGRGGSGYRMDDSEMDYRHRGGFRGRNM